MTIGIEKSVREEMLLWMTNTTSPAASQPANTHFLQWHTADPGIAGATAVSTALPSTPRDTLTGGAGAQWVVGTADDGILENSTLGETVAAGGADTITHFSVFDASTAGNFLFSGTVTPNAVIATSGKLTYGAGDLTVTLTGAA